MHNNDRVCCSRVHYGLSMLVVRVYDSLSLFESFTLLLSLLHPVIVVVMYDDVVIIIIIILLLLLLL